MSWFTNFFKAGKAKQEDFSGNTINGSDFEDVTPNIAEGLFIDNEPPNTEADFRDAPRSENKLVAFLNENYASRGYNDGYDYHTQDILENKKKALKADFREMVDIIIDEKGKEALKLKNHLIDTEGLSDRLHRQLENRINELQSIINKLEKEKELSSVDEGLVMKVIHNYRDGFLRGVEDYQTQKLLGRSTGLFD